MDGRLWLVDMDLHGDVGWQGLPRATRGAIPVVFIYYVV